MTIIQKGERMSDLISRQAAIDAVMKFMPSLTTPDGCGQFDREIYETQEMFVDIGQALSDLPSAERRGRWENIEHAPNGLLYATCSVCGKRQTVEAVNYCGNCGARMEASE